MATWDKETKEKAIEEYKEANPTPANTMEIVKELADKYEQSPNGLRMVLIQAGAYIKQDAKKSETKEGKSEATKRVSKESAVGALKAAIEEVGAEVDQDILDKLTGKAAVYFTSVIKHK